MAKKRVTVLDFSQNYQAYEKTMISAEGLFNAGMTLFKINHNSALGQFELGQEEVGKSFSILSAFGYGSNQDVWKMFWKDWRDHKVKVARSFFYEWFSPWRITVLNDNGVPIDGHCREGFFNGIPKEKESAFYVNYDELTGSFKAPGDSIESIDSANRGSSLLSHYTTAMLTKSALDEGDKEWNYKVFSEIPSRIMSVFTPQEDMPTIIGEFQSRSPKHKILVNSIIEHYCAGAEFMKTIKANVK